MADRDFEALASLSRRPWSRNNVTGLRPQGERSQARGVHSNNWRMNIHSRSDQTTDSLEAQPTGFLLRTITLSEIESSMGSADGVEITNYEYISSYNWLNRNTPTILVPGSPPLWTPPILPPSLKWDSDDYFKDIDAAYWPKFPMEPTIRAILTERPDFKASKIDVVSCGNVMRNLFRFADSIERSFRFNMEVIGNTLFLVRREIDPKELIPNVRGYGHTFPEAYTSWDKDLKDSISHQRVIKYNFGGIQCLLRFEVDGYLKNENSEGGNPISSPNLLTASKDIDAPSLQVATESISISKKSHSYEASLTIEHAGHQVPQDSIFDLKTRSVRNELDMEEEYLRLWVSQMHKFILARHTSGIFNDVRVMEMISEVGTWEAKKKLALQRLHTIFQQLIKSAKNMKVHKVEVRRIGFGPLEIRKLPAISWNALPGDLKARWTGISSSRTDVTAEFENEGFERHNGCEAKDDDDHHDFEEFEHGEAYLTF